MSMAAWSTDALPQVARLLWASGSIAHKYGWPDFKMAAPINVHVLAFSQQYHR